MKKITFIIFLIFVLGSCKAYHQINLKSPKIETSKRYKIITKSGNVIKSKIFLKDNNTLTYYHKKEEETLKLSEIESIRGKSYSKEKTVNSILIFFSVILSISIG
ncbi:MAG: hypothetical protein V3U80_04430 [Flavobacteriaceae bacterium]